MVKKERQGKNLCDRTFEFSKRIVLLCQTLYAKPGASRMLSNQLIRSGTSIGANVEEAQGGHSRKDFLYKISLACKEARETLYWLRLLAATEIVKLTRLKEIMCECDELVAILTTIVKKTKGA